MNDANLRAPTTDTTTMRRVCELYGDGLSVTAVGKALGISRGAVAGRIHRLRKELQESCRDVDVIARLLSMGMTVEKIEGKACFASYALAEMRRGLGEQAC